MRITIVSHCWKYSRCLAYQLSSLFLHHPQARVMVHVCHCEDADRPTDDLLDWFAAPERMAIGSHIELWRDPKELHEVLQRAIGRNDAARSTASRPDVVFFTDADYFFGPGCLDAIPELEPDVLYYPKTVLRHKTHAIGDEYIRRVTGTGIYDVDPADFEPVRGRPIGGLQIVSGETARARGYCPNSKWQRPLAESATKFEFRSDIAYRRQFKRQVPLDLPNLYRIRQTTSGEVDSL